MGLSAVAEIGCGDLDLRYSNFLRMVYDLRDHEESPEEFFILLSIAFMSSIETVQDDQCYQEATTKLQSLSAKYPETWELTVAMEGVSRWHSLELKLAGGQKQKSRLLTFLPPDSGGIKKP